jgi:hypothetical protein
VRGGYSEALSWFIDCGEFRTGEQACRRSAPLASRPSSGAEGTGVGEAPGEVGESSGEAACEATDSTKRPEATPGNFEGSV